MTSLPPENKRSLQSRLAAVVASLPETLSPDQLETLERGNRWLTDAGFASAALQVGETAADFALPNQNGRIVRLADRLIRGPVVLVFFRGQWCPYCGVTLQAWQRQLESLSEAGGSLLAISPQTSEACAAMASELALDFDLLSDVGSEIAGAFRISYRITPEMQSFYLGYGARLLEANGGDAGQLPLPATFVLDSSATVRLADVNPLPSQRLEPGIAIAALRRIRQRGLNA